MPWIASKPRVRWTRNHSDAPNTGQPAVVVDKPVGWREVAHPDLHPFTDAEFKRRTDFWARLFYCRPSEYVNWYGDMLRDDGGQGMYATDAQHQAWPNKVVSDIKIGPS